MRKALYHFVTTLLIIIFLLAGTVFFVFTTETGTCMAFQIASVLLQKKFTVGAIQGRLLDSLNLENIVYQSSDITLHVEHAQLQWRASLLLYGHIPIEKISINQADIKINNNTSQTTSASTHKKNILDLFSSLEIDKLDLQNITVQYTDENALKIKNLTGRIRLDQTIFLDMQTELTSPFQVKTHLIVQGTPKIYQWHLSLQSNNSNWLANGQGDENGFTFNTPKNKFLNGELSILGKVNWSPTLNGQLSLTAKSLDLKLLNTNLLGNLNLNAQIAGNMDKFTIDSTMQLGSTHAELKGSLSDRWYLDYKMNAPRLDQLLPSLAGSLNLTGNLRGSSKHPELNTKLLFKHPIFQGDLAADIQLKDILEKKNMRGVATLQSKQLRVSKQGIQLRDLYVTARAGNETINYTGSVKSDKGSLQLQGKTLLKNNVFNTSLLINGEEFLVSNTTKIKLYVSPHLTIENKTDGWYISGKIIIPTADLKLVDITTTVTLPPETIVIKPSGIIKQDKALPVFTQIELILGNNVHLESSGISSVVTGRLLIKDYPDTEPLAMGRLNLTKGNYDLKGQKLAIDNSAFIFTNSAISNPNLNIRATKTIQYAPVTQTLTEKQTLTVGMLVTGTAENPHILLFSDPAGWSQPDILSLILLGQPASMASGANLQLLTLAAKTLTPQTGTGFSQLNQQLQQFFGLNEFGIQSDLVNQPGVEKNSTSFVVGKYLSPRLYLNYSVNVLNSVNTLRLRYLLGKNWFIQTQANTLGSGVDILYSIEH